MSTIFQRRFRGNARAVARAIKRTTRFRTRTRNRRSGGRRRFARRKLPLFEPYSTFRRMRTTYVASMDPGAAGAISTTLLKLNSVYDPTGNAGGSGGSIQPNGYDAMELLYNKYCVVKAAVKIEAVSTDNSYPLVVGICPSRDSSALTTFVNYKQLPGCVSRLVTPDEDRTEMYGSYRVKKFMLPSGASIYGADDLNSAVSTDPARILYGHIFIQSVEGSADAAAVRLVVTIDQWVKFYEPKTLGLSTQ